MTHLIYILTLAICALCLNNNYWVMLIIVGFWGDRLFWDLLAVTEVACGGSGGRRIAQALALKSGGCGFMSRYDHLAGVVSR